MRKADLIRIRQCVEFGNMLFSTEIPVIHQKEYIVKVLCLGKTAIINTRAAVTDNAISNVLTAAVNTVI